MSNKSTNTLKTVGTSIIIVLLAVGLSMFMITDVFTPSNANAVAMVGKKDISLQKFDSVFSRRLQEQNAANDTKLTSPQAYANGFADQVLDQMITSAAIEVDADELGVGVANKVAREQFENMEVFKDPITGLFSEDTMRSVLANARIRQDDFEADVVSDIKSNQVVSAAIAGIKAPLQYAEQRYKFLTEQRKVTSLTLTQAAVPAPETPSDEVLQAFIDENEAVFTAPEFRRFTMIRAELTDVAPDVKLEDGALQAQYDYKVSVGKVGTAETRSLTLLNATNETLAKQALEALKSGKTAAEVSTELGFVEPTVYVDTGEAEIIDPDAAKAAFAAKAGETSIIEGKLGWFVIAVDNITPATFPTFEELKDELEKDMKKDQAEGQLYDLVEAIETALDEGESLEAAAKTAGASVASYDFISRLGQTQDDMRMDGISVLTGIAGDDAILTEVFTNDPEYETDIFDTSKGGYASIRVDDIIDSRKRTLDEVRGQATQMWKNKQLETALTDLADAIKTRVDGGESLQSVKDSLPKGASVEDLVIVRSSRAPSLGPLVTVRLFEGKKGDVVRGDGPEALTRNIAMLTDIVSNSDDMAGGFADAMQLQATNALSSDIQQAYRQAIINTNGVQKFDDRIKMQLGVTE